MDPVAFELVSSRGRCRGGIKNRWFDSLEKQTETLFKMQGCLCVGKDFRYIMVDSVRNLYGFQFEQSGMASI